MDSNSFSFSNVNEAEKVLRKILSLLDEYNKIFGSLSPIERALAGGVIFNLSCPAGDFALLGAVAERPFISFLSAQLGNFISHADLNQGRVIEFFNNDSGGPFDKKMS